ncbi:MAG: hypothetical protein ACOYB2_03025 [Limnohabitans sp.]|jgi:hypothetical protein
MADIFQVHEAARIRTGKYAGMVGTVTETRTDDAGKQTGVRVKMDGVFNGEPMTAHVWVKRSSVERNHGA